MFRRTTRSFLALAAFAATTTMTSVAQAHPPTELMGDGSSVIPLKNAAMIVKTDDGYRYIAGQQDSHLTVTEQGGKILYRDTGTRELRKRPRSCSEQDAAKGIAVLCKIPARYDNSHKMFLEVWPRLGDDFVDGSAMSSMFRMWVLADAGNDRVFGGDGNDFVNGAMDVDKVWGGAGNDWIRSGENHDVVWGGSGQDKIVAGPQNDDAHGGDGNDLIYGIDGSDTLWGDAGADTLSCGKGYDYFYRDSSDRVRSCEHARG